MHEQSIVELKGVIKGNGDEIFMLMETAKGDAEQLFQKVNDLVKDNVISPETQNIINKVISKDILEGLLFLQKDRSMIHLDLKMENYFMRPSEGKAVLGDFGSSKRTTDAFNINNFDATVSYAAPEVLERGKDIDIKTLISDKADVWSAGLVVNAIFNGQDTKLSHKFSTGATNNILNFGKDYTNRLIDEPKNALDEIINSMAHPDPSERPTIEAVLKTSVFSDEKLDKPQIRELMKELLSSEIDVVKLTRLSQEIDNN